MMNFMLGTSSATTIHGRAGSANHRGSSRKIWGSVSQLVALVLGICSASTPVAAQDPGWYGLLGDRPGDTTFRDAVNARLATETRLTTICTSTLQQDRNQCQLMMPPDDPNFGGLQGHWRQQDFAPFPLLTPPSSQGVPVRKVDWQPVADALSAYVNIHKLARLAGDPADIYKNQAKGVADWFLSWNRWLRARQDQTRALVDTRHDPNDPIIPPYVGWYEADARDGFFNADCAGTNRFPVLNDRGDYVAGNGTGDAYADPAVIYGADESWDTAAAVRGLLKYSEIDDLGVNSEYFQRAKEILEAWPFRDHASGDGNPETPDLASDPSRYAHEGMLWFRKSNEPCEIRYVKNTDLVMGEQLFRLYTLSRNRLHLDAAKKVLYAQLWDIVSHQNFGYNSFMTRDLAHSGNIYDRIVADDRAHKTIDLPDGTIVCRPTNSSCWNHLGFEGYDLYAVQQLISGPEFVPGDFPVPNMDLDLAGAITQTMDRWRSSSFGNPDQWVSGSATHLTAYNCALRFSTDPTRVNDCRTALGHNPTGHTIFYSLVPDGIFTQGPAH